MNSKILTKKNKIKKNIIMVIERVKDINLNNDISLENDILLDYLEKNIIKDVYYYYYKFLNLIKDYKLIIVLIIIFIFVIINNL
jgi:hypothetical protein